MPYCFRRSSILLLSFSATGCLKPLGCVELLQCAPPGVTLNGDAATSPSTINDASSESAAAMEGGVRAEAGLVSNADASVPSSASSDVDDAASEAGVSRSAESPTIVSSTWADASLDGAAKPNCSNGTYWSDADGGACVPWTTCESGTYVGMPGSAEADRQCLDCPQDSYSTDENSSSCSPCNHCGWLGLESECTARRDAVCRSTDVTRQFGVAEADYVTGVAVDTKSNVWVVGRTAGSLGGETHGSFDAVVLIYPPNATTPTIDQFGTSEDEGVTAVTADKDGRRLRS